MWCTYIIRTGNGNLYTGATNNIFRRYYQHLNGTGAKYMRSQPRPFTLEYLRFANCKSDAMKREYQIKQLTKQQKEKLIHENRIRK